MRTYYIAQVLLLVLCGKWGDTCVRVAAEHTQLIHFAAQQKLTHICETAVLQQIF